MRLTHTIKNRTDSFNASLDLERDAIIKVLRAWGNKDFSMVHNKSLGICYNLSYILGGVSLGYRIVEFASKGWEKYSGTYEYPIPINKLPQWSNNDRLELCLYLADRLEGGFVATETLYDEHFKEYDMK